MSTFELRRAPLQDTAAVRISCSLADIGSTMGPAFEKVAAAVASAGSEPVAPAFARYYSVGEDGAEFDCGFGVTVPFTGNGEVQAGHLGGCDVAFATHIGPYETIGETWEALAAWVGEQGRELSGPGWEAYLTDPSTEPDPAKWATEIFLPLK